MRQLKLLTPTLTRLMARGGAVNYAREVEATLGGLIHNMNGLLKDQTRGKGEATFLLNKQLQRAKPKLDRLLDKWLTHVELRQQAANDKLKSVMVPSDTPKHLELAKALKEQVKTDPAAIGRLTKEHPDFYSAFNSMPAAYFGLSKKLADEIMFNGARLHYPNEYSELEDAMEFFEAFKFADDLVRKNMIEADMLVDPRFLETRFEEELDNAPRLLETSLGDDNG